MKLMLVALSGLGQGICCSAPEVGSMPSLGAIHLHDGVRLELEDVNFCD